MLCYLKLELGGSVIASCGDWPDVAAAYLCIGVESPHSLVRVARTTGGVTVAVSGGVLDGRARGRDVTVHFARCGIRNPLSICTRTGVGRRSPDRAFAELCRVPLLMHGQLGGLAVWQRGDVCVVVCVCCACRRRGGAGGPARERTNGPG